MWFKAYLASTYCMGFTLIMCFELNNRAHLFLETRVKQLWRNQTLNFTGDFTKLPPQSLFYNHFYI